MSKIDGDNSYRVQFENGPEVALVTVAGAVVARPHYHVADGARVFSADADCGIGLVTDGAGLFPSVLGAEYSSALAGAVGLPEAIEASLMAPDGTWFGQDVTDAVLDMDLADILALEDGRLPSNLSLQIGEPHIAVEIVAAVSFYFGRMPRTEGAAARVSREISQTDLEQARIVRRWQAPAAELAGPSFSPFG